MTLKHSIGYSMAYSKRFWNTFYGMSDIGYPIEDSREFYRRSIDILLNILKDFRTCSIGCSIEYAMEYSP